MATSFNVIQKQKACGDPKETDNGYWETTSKVDIWDENNIATPIVVIQQVQYVCKANYQLATGATSFVNCNHGTNSFTPEPPVCELDTGQILLLI